MGLLFMFTSCKLVRSIVEINKKSAKIYQYKSGDREIKFIPMHHLGKQCFYDDVKRDIIDQKNKGYVVYYELISTNFTKDSLLKDTIRRKVRKLKGFSGTYKENAEGTPFKKHIQQPAYKELGVEDTDLRADVDYLELIHQWEKVNGKIVLDSMDLNTPFTEKFNKGIFYTKKQYKKIFIEYRNEHLIEMIKSSPNKKILVVYGAGHRKDFKRRLKRS